MKPSRHLLLTAALLGGCAAPQPPATVRQANAVSTSPSAEEAERLAPQATAVARALADEASDLSLRGETEKAEVVGEQALAAFQEAFALAQAAKSEVLVEQAETDLHAAEERLAHLQRAQLLAQREAEAFEMRARVALDQELVVDVATLTPERSLARRQAALQLSSEARLLCLAARLVGNTTDELTQVEASLGELNRDLSTGSARKDMYPRAVESRTACLTQLTLTRRQQIQKAPDRAGTDRLLRELAETGRVLAFRDDRGVVVNLKPERDAEGNLVSSLTDVVALLARTSQQNPSYPLLVVGHSAQRAVADAAERTAELFAEDLRRAGAKSVTATAVGSTQPLVDSRLRGATEQNERLEVIFVAPAR